MADFYKYHGLGNDYIVIDPSKSLVTMSEKNVRLICDRNFGVGSDGILYGPVKKNNKIHLKIFNPDGSEAEKSGNGIRIFAQYMWDSKYIKEHKFSIETKSGTVTAEQLDTKTSLIKVDMGIFSFATKDIPTKSSKKFSLDETILVKNRKFDIDCVTIGNPHCVIILNTISPEIAKEYGPILENSTMFPNRTNVQFVKVLDKKNIQIEIWERGAGYTMASGSSSVAATCVAHKKNLIEPEVTVHMPGGSVEISIKNNRAFLTGIVSRIMQGDFAQEFINQLEVD